jgi:hypothetical protein
MGGPGLTETDGCLASRRHQAVLAPLRQMSVMVSQEIDGSIGPTETSRCPDLAETSDHPDHAETDGCAVPVETWGYSGPAETTAVQTPWRRIAVLTHRETDGYPVVTDTNG